MSGNGQQIDPRLASGDMLYGSDNSNIGFAPAAMQQAPGVGGGGFGIQPVPMGLQVDPAYGQQPQFQMQGSQPRVNGVHSNGLLGQGQIGNTRYGQQRLQMDPSYGQQPMPTMTSRPAPIGRIRGR